jgi:hypothetical protein
MRLVAIVFFAVAVSVSTLLVFPGLAYVSIATFGAPASLFLLAAFGLWVGVHRRWSRVADVFWVAVAAPVAVVPLPFVVVAAQLVVYIVAPTLLAEVIRRRYWKRRAA